MEALRASCVPSTHLLMIQKRQQTTQNEKPMLNFSINSIPNSPFSLVHTTTSRTKLFSTVSSTISTERTDPVEPELETPTQEDKFDWYSQWYAVMPVCDLDKRKPHAKKVMGLDIVVWWDRNESAWKVFDDSCPHRLAPLSEGRIDQWGRLQCVYHGWCFNGSGDCKFIPQAPPDGPPVLPDMVMGAFIPDLRRKYPLHELNINDSRLKIMKDTSDTSKVHDNMKGSVKRIKFLVSTFKKACVSVYPSTVQNNIVWFWPSTDPQYKDILVKKKPPYIPELDDPSYTKLMTNRDIPYGYEVLIENLMDPAHVPYAHYGILRIPTPKNRPKADREGGRPLDINLQTYGIDGFLGNQQYGSNRFFPPCVYCSTQNLSGGQSNVSVPTSGSEKDPPPHAAQRRVKLVFICIPVSPGKSRLIWSFPRNFGVWIDRVVPRWMFHIQGNLVLDSDLYLLHVEERKIMDVGPSNWQKACFVPTKSDANVVAFRKWLNKYSGGQVDWGTKFSGALPHSPPREQLMDRYWSHVVNCSSCSAAYKGLNALEVALKVISIATIGIVAAAKQSMMSVAARATLVSMAVLCFAVSRWLSYFIYKNFHFHDYNHALR